MVEKNTPPGDLSSAFYRWRVGLGLTQGHVARLAGISRQHINGFECGRRSMSAKYRVRLMKLMEKIGRKQE